MSNCALPITTMPSVTPPIIAMHMTLTIGRSDTRQSSTEHKAIMLKTQRPQNLDSSKLERVLYLYVHMIIQLVFTIPPRH